MEMTPAEIAERVQQSWASFLVRDRQTPTPRPYVFASGYRACLRRTVLEMTRPAERPPWSADVLARFRRGADRERDLLMDLQRIGRDANPPFEIVAQQQRYELVDRRSRIAIVGKIDATMRVNGFMAPLEVKSWSPMVTDRIHVFEDVFSSPWTMSGGMQLLAYLFAAGEPFGFLLLDRSGLPRLLPVELEPNLDRVELFLQQAEQALDHVEAKTLPDYIDDPAECRRCDFYGTACNPPLSATGAQVLSDPELEAALERREALKAAAKEYEALDDDVKRQLKGIESGVVGAFNIEGKWSKYSRVELPADVKKQYTTVDPKGRFTLTITKLEGR